MIMKQRQIDDINDKYLKLQHELDNKEKEMK